MIHGHNTGEIHISNIIYKLYNIPQKDQQHTMTYKQWDNYGDNIT